MQLKLNAKLTSIIALALLSILVSFYFAFKRMHEENLNDVIQKRVAHAEYTMQRHEKLDTNMLSAALKVFLEDEAFKDVYLSRDRERLYSYGQPLFKELKNKYGITHFYFHLPEGRIFIRLHNKDIYGDEVNRITFNKAKATKEFAGGIELGMTAFALRVVAPYYKGNELIGYVEFGEEIEHFLDTLRGETSNDFAIIARKECLSRKDWSSVRKTAGLSDNWDDLKNYLWISRTVEPAAAKGCFTDKNIEQFEKGVSFIKDFPGGKEGFACGGFPIHDASGKTVGAVMSLIDISEQTALFNKTQRNLAVVFVSLSVLTFLTIGLFMRYYVSRPIERLSRSANIIASGDMTHRTTVSSKDEIGELANSMNIMASQIGSYCGNLQVIVDEKTKELRDSEERARSITDTAGDAIICLEKPDIINLWNKKAEAMFGYTAEEAMGKMLHELIVPARYRKESYEGLDLFFKTGSGPVVGKTVELSAFRRDGTEFPIELSVAAMKIRGKWQSSGIVREITERKKAQEEIARQRDELQRMNTELSALYQVAMAISRTIDLQKLLYDILFTVVGLDVFNVEHKGGIFVVEGDKMNLVSHIGFSEPFLALHKNTRVGDCLCGLAAKTGEVVISNDSHEDERHTIRYDGMTHHGHVIVPLMTADKVVGVLCLYIPADVKLDKGKIDLLSSIGSQIGIAIENSKLYEQTKALSLHDPLTGLANRRYMEIFLERGFNEARRYGRLLSVIMLDIDHFKKYNDTHGHQAGDKLLQEIARIIMECVRDTDLVARYGGEEFLILLPEIDMTRAPEVAERLRRAVEEKAGVTISLGVSSFSQGMEKKEELVHKADEALYRAKEEGRNRVVMASIKT